MISRVKPVAFAVLLALLGGDACGKVSNAPPNGGPMSIGGQWSSSGYNASDLGGIWRQKAYSGWAFNKEFNAANTDRLGDAPAISLLSIGYANGTSKDVVANMGVAIANANRSSLFGFNFIATSTGNKSAIFRGGEIDVEPATTDTPLPGSAGLYFNAFNKAVPGPVIQSNGINGGSFANGFSCGGVTGTCLFAPPGSSSASLVNASPGIYRDAAFITGAGRSQGFAWGTRGSGTSPFTYGDPSNNFVLQLGAGGFDVKDRSGTATLFQVRQTGVVTMSSALQLPRTTAAALPPCAASNEGELAAVTDADRATFNAPIAGRGANHVLAYCNGSRWTVH